MTQFLIVIFVNIFALFMVSNIVHGISIEKWQTLVVSAIVLTFINFFLKPVIKFIMLPINILSLGFFTLIINAFLLYSVEKIVKGFYIANFWSAFIGALLMSMIYIILETFIMKKKIIVFKNNSYKKTYDKNVIDVEATYEKKDDEKDK